MSGFQKRKTAPRINPVAKALRLRSLAQKRVEGGKGYTRRPKHVGKEEA